MNLKIIRPKNEKETLSLSTTKSSETLFEQTHRKAEETMEFKLTKSIETFPFNPTIKIEGDWINGLTVSEVYNPIFIITDKDNKFELYKLSDLLNGENKFESERNTVKERMGISDITQDLLDETIGPTLTEEHGNAYQEKIKLTLL